MNNSLVEDKTERSTYVGQKCLAKASFAWTNQNVSALGQFKINGMVYGFSFFFNMMIQYFLFHFYNTVFNFP